MARIDLNALRIFTEVGRLGSFSAAAARVDMPASTVSRKVADLEEALGQKLLLRNTRRIGLTDAGALLLTEVDDRMVAMQAALEVAMTTDGPVRGTLRIATSHVLCQSLLPRVLSAYARACPQVQVDVSTHHADTDLIGDGIDIAIRMGEPREGDLIHRRIGAVRPRLFAAPSLLAGKLILSPDDLAGMPFVTHRRRLLRGRLNWELEHDGTSIVLDHRPAVVVDDPSLARAMVVQGLGIGLLTDADVQGADLAPVFPQWAARPIPIYYVLHPKQRDVPKIRAFAEILKDVRATC